MNPAAWSPWLSNFDAAAYFIVAALVIWLAFFGDRAKGRKRCPKCWYDMNAAPAPGLTCSECGHVCKKASQLYKARWRWKPVFMGTVACLLTFAVSNWANLRAGAWMKLVPSTVLYLAVEPDYSSPLRAPSIVPDGSGGWTLAPAQAARPSSIDDVKQLLGRELGRRHREGELPSWIWRSVSLDGFAPPVDKSRWLHTRRKWPKRQNLILGSELAARLLVLPNPGNLAQRTRLEISEAARAMGVGEWAMIIENTSLPSRPVSEVRYHIDTSRLPFGRHRIPLSVTCTEHAGPTNSIELWRSDFLIELEIVDSVEGVVTLANDPHTNAAVRSAADVTFLRTQLNGRNAYDTLKADVHPAAARVPPVADLGIAFTLRFYEFGREVAFRHDDLQPPRADGFVFTSDEVRERLMPHGLWSDEALATLVVRVEGRPEAVVPQLDFSRAWSGNYEVPLSQIVTDLPAPTSGLPASTSPPTLLFEPPEPRGN